MTMEELKTAIGFTEEQKKLCSAVVSVLELLGIDQATLSSLPSIAPKLDSLIAETNQVVSAIREDIQANADAIKDLREEGDSTRIGKNGIESVLNGLTEKTEVLSFNE